MATSLIGGIGLTLVTVYEQRPAPDGQTSGSPHIHAVTDEAYYIVAGTGHAEFHDPVRGFRRAALRPGVFLQFEPCILHRLVSTGGLQVLGIMGNAGLTEAGDARIYFGAGADANPEVYTRLWNLPRARGLEGALERRDSAVAAYTTLLDLWDTDRPAYFAELSRFIGVTRREAAEKRAAYEAAVEAGPARWARRASRAIAALPSGPDAAGIIGQQPWAEPAFGMCGTLQPVLNPVPLPTGADDA